MTTASQGTSFVGKTVPNPLLKPKSKGISFFKKYFLLTQPVLVLFFKLELLTKCDRAQLKKIKTIIRFIFVVEKIMNHSLSWLREIFCQLHQMAFSF